MAPSFLPSSPAHDLPPTISLTRVDRSVERKTGPNLVFGAATSVTADPQAGCYEPEGCEDPEGRQASGPVKCSLRHVAHRAVVIQAVVVPIVAIRPPQVVAVPILGGVVRRVVALVAVIPPGAVSAPVAPPARVPIPRAVARLFVRRLFVRRRRGLVDRLGALDRLLWVQLDRRADVL